MIKKIRQRINKTSLYWKTWVITAVTILLTIGLFFIVFSLFATKFLEANQNRKFSQTIEAIYESVGKDGINDKFLEQQMINGYNIFIVQNDHVLYPNYEHATVKTFSSSSSVIESADEATQVVPSDTIIGFANDYQVIGVEAAFLNDQRMIMHKGQMYSVEVSYPIAVNSEEIKSVITAIIPYFIVIGLLVSFVISIIYARYFSRKITHLNQTVHQMASSSVLLNYQAKEGDELQDLENNVHYMYQELQATLGQLNQEVETVKRLESDRQVFMRGATHELKTPIMAMTTMLEGMIQEVDGYDNHEEYLQKCYGRLQSMNRLVNEMLEVSKIESVIFDGETELQQATSELIELYNYMIVDKSLALDVSQLSVGTITIASGNVKKVLSNLIGNAVKYTPENGKITISGNQSYWEIRNQVTQVAGLEQGQIFSPFISLENDSDHEFGKSHGLGLYIVATILKQYDYHYQWHADSAKKEFVFKIDL